MKFFEKNIKDRFQNASSLQGVDAEDLWNQINPEIETKTTKKPFFFLRRRLAFVLLLSIITGGIMLWKFSSSDSNAVVNQQKNETSSAHSEESNASSSNYEQSLSPVNHQKNSNIHTSNLNTLKNKKSFSTDVAIIENKKETDLNKKNSVESNTLISNSIQTSTPNDNLIYSNVEKINSTVSTQEPAQNKSQNQIGIGTPFLKNKLSHYLFDGKKIDFKAIAPNFTLLSLKQSTPIEIKELIKLSKPSKKRDIRIGAFLGLHTLKNKFATDIAANQERRNLLNQGFQLEIGYSLGAEVSLFFTEKLFITSGLEYLKSKSEFNLERNWKTTIVNPNSPVGALTDAFVKRTVRHHNKMNYLSIPVLIGYEKNFNKINLGLSAGAGFNVVSTQTGKSLNSDNEIAIYPVSENNNLPVSDFFMSYHFRPYFSYDLTEKITAQLRTDFRFQNFGTSDFYQLKYRSFFWGLSGGVQYKF